MDILLIFCTFASVIHFYYSKIMAKTEKTEEKSLYPKLYFSLSEFFKNCSYTEMYKALSNLDICLNLFCLWTRMNMVRESVGSVLIVNSGYRTPERNKAVGGVPTSQHLVGAACDIRKSYDLSRFLHGEDGNTNTHHIVQLFGFYQIIEYDTFVHFSVYDKKHLDLPSSYIDKRTKQQKLEIND